MYRLPYIFEYALSKFYIYYYNTNTDVKRMCCSCFHNNMIKNMCGLDSLIKRITRVNYKSLIIYGEYFQLCRIMQNFLT